MLPPDQRLFEEDLESVGYLDGVVKGHWGIADPTLVPKELQWPEVVLWIAPAVRENAPDRFYIKLNLSGYRADPPTGTFWDPETKASLEFSKRPKGRSDSRIAKVFRTDWEGGRGFYHPYDRLGAKTHADWRTQQPHLIWTSEHTIVDYLEEFSALLHLGDYLGI